MKPNFHPKDLFFAITAKFSQKAKDFGEKSTIKQKCRDVYNTFRDKSVFGR